MGQTAEDGVSVDLSLWRDVPEGGPAAAHHRAARQAAFATIIAAYDRRLRVFAYHLLGSREAMDDVLQEVYLKAYADLGSLRRQAALISWLHRITYTSCMDALRRSSSAYPLALDESADPTGAEMDSEVALHDELRRALIDLAPELCAAVLLVLYEGYSYDEAAGILGIPRGTVASRVAAGRERLACSLSRSSGREASDEQR